MNNGLKAESSRCLKAMFTSLYLVVLIIGVTLGILLVRPLVHVAVADDRLEPLGTWLLKLDGSGNVVTGGSFNVKVKLYNSAIFPVTFEPRKAAFYHYPIGSHVDCLKVNYSGNFAEDEVVATKITKLHKDVLPENTDGLISLRDLTVTVPPKKERFAAFSLTLPVKGYFSVSSSSQSELGELKPLYLDCKKHSRLLLSMRIEDIQTKFWLFTRRVPSVYEIMLPLQCQVESGVDAKFANAQLKFSGSMLSQQANLPDRELQAQQAP